MAMLSNQRTRSITLKMMPLLWLFLSIHAYSQPFDELIEHCAPRVHPTTLKALIRTESNGHFYAIADAGPAHLPWRIRKNQVRSFFPSTLEKAEKLAEQLIEEGHIIAVGLTQISSRNLKQFGFTLKQALDPCLNLHLGEKVLANFYANALKKYKSPDQALLAAISAYNTGNFRDGFDNGYVGTFIAHATAPKGAGSIQRLAKTTLVTAKKRNNKRLFEAKLASIEADF